MKIADWESAFVNQSALTRVTAHPNDMIKLSLRG